MNGPLCLLLMAVLASPTWLPLWAAWREERR